MNFEQLYRAHYADVRRFALYLTGDHAQADDITAETFVRAWAADAPLRATSLKAYLLTIARNLHRQASRAARRQEPVGADLPDPRPGPETIAAAGSELRATLRRLAALPEIDRAALLMRAFNGLPYDDIATALGITVASAKVKIHRARAALAAGPAQGAHHDS